MNLKQKAKTYSFWISLISAILIVVRIVGEHFNWFINEGFIMDTVTAVCGVLVLLGILSAPTNNSGAEVDTDELKEKSKEIQDNQKQLNSIIKEDIMAEQLTIQQQIEMLKKDLKKDDQNIEIEKGKDEITEQETEQTNEELTTQNNAITEPAKLNESLQPVESTATAEPQLYGLMVSKLSKDENCLVDDISNTTDDKVVEQNKYQSPNDIADTQPEQMMLGIPQEQENTACLDISFKDENPNCNSIEICTQSTGLNEPQTENINEIVTEDFSLEKELSSLDKKQLKFLLMEILKHL